MRTALEMADFILSKQPGLDIYFNAEKAREKRRRHYADLFRPIERALGPNFGLAAGVMTTSSMRSHRMMYTMQRGYSAIQKVLQPHLQPTDASSRIK